MKRYQECNDFVKLWRKRWYLWACIKWLWFSTIGEFRVFKDEVVDGVSIHTDEYDVMKGKNLWKLLLGDAQGNMAFYWTHEEVQQKFKQLSCDHEWVDYKYEGDCGVCWKCQKLAKDE